MDNDTLLGRLVRLLRKSKRALQLYTTVGRQTRNSDGEHTEAQLLEWRTVNADLIDLLLPLVEASSFKNLSQELTKVLEQFRTKWRTTQTELNELQRRLIASAENGDFVRASQLSRDLISLKARTQASQAGFHELEAIINYSGASIDDRAQVDEVGSELEAGIESSDRVGLRSAGSAKIIPLRRGSGTAG